MVVMPFIIFFLFSARTMRSFVTLGSPMSVEGAVVHGVVLVVFTRCRRYGEAQPTCQSQ